MTSWHLDIWKVKIWLSQDRKDLLKWNKAHFYLVFRHKKQTSKNLEDQTFNISSPVCHYSILAPEVTVLPKSYYQHELKGSNKEKASLSFISLLLVKFTKRNIFTNERFVTLYVRNTSQENTATQLLKKNKESHLF